MKIFKILLIVFLCQVNIVLACTSFGIITESGTIIAKNRDYYYGKQNFELIHPIRQFAAWYGNPYGHMNEFFALTARNDISYGVNKYGLAIVEEDHPRILNNPLTQRKYMQPYQGYAEGMIMYGILQNFATIDEIIPYINDIFSTAAPNYYQIADKKNILMVEVAYGKDDKDPIRKYSYKILNKKGDYSAHTNSFLTTEFLNLNNLPVDIKSVTSSKSRLNKITEKIKAAKGDFSKAFDWYLDTRSDISVPNIKNSCLNTSLFRSYLNDLSEIKSNINYDDVYGTVSSFLLENNTNDAIVHVRIIDKVSTLKNGNQIITYRELNLPLQKLFAAKILPFKTHTFTRHAPVDEKCT